MPENDNNDNNDDNNDQNKKNDPKDEALAHQVGYRIDRESPQIKPENTLEAELVAHSTVAFTDSFMERLRKSFNEEEWRLQREKNILTLTSLKQTPSKELTIRYEQQGMVFSGSHCEKEIVLAANAYQEACQLEGEKIIFEIDADNEEAAIRFMNNLKNEGFDLSKIAAVNCKDKALDPSMKEEYTKEVLAKVGVAPRSRPLSSPKPPGTI